jgi:acetyl-CoA acetyltransferase
MQMEDTTIGWRFINPQMKALYGVDSMPETAENVADDFAISRADQDAFACAASCVPRRRRRPDALPTS